MRQDNTLPAPKHTTTSYRDRVMGCWLGKAVGGTLGMPFEGVDGPLDLTFYQPVPTKMLPNDDLDLQVVWACVMDAEEPVCVSRHPFAQAWRENIQFPWDEYGVALRNMALGLTPPTTGSYDNWFARSMGAAIRSELWACLAPREPHLAAKYAYEDACVDHAGEGIAAEMFFAALQSLAFVEQDTDRLLEGALHAIDPQSEVHLAVQQTRAWWKEAGDWRQVRVLILKDFEQDNFTDVVMNVAFTVLGWRAGEGDFGRSICIAANCGKDTDCTAATVGALLGILNPDCIPEAWLAPIGRDLVLSPDIIGLKPPATLDGFTDLVMSLRERLNGAEPQVDTRVEDTRSLAIPAEYAFLDSFNADEPPSPVAGWRDIAFGGSIGNWPQDAFAGEFLALRYKFHLSQKQQVVILFNTPQECRVWLDGAFLLAREGGSMAPSFHRAPKDQVARLVAGKGDHEIIALVRRPANGAGAEWVIGIGDDTTQQWIPNAFARIGRLPLRSSP